MCLAYHAKNGNPPFLRTRMTVSSPQFRYITGFTEMEVAQFCALLAKRKYGLDSVIRGFWDFIQNSRNSYSQNSPIDDSTQRVKNAFVVTPSGGIG
jgi:hypothetical protein